MTDSLPLYAVFGRPVAHSLSPWIHHQFALQEGVAIEYQRREVTGMLNSALSVFLSAGGLGANVTLPCKTEAFELADELSDNAKRAGAVNTLRFDAEKKLWQGFNTDGAGFIADIAHLGVDLHNLSVVVLGAGGASMGILPAILDAAPSRIVVANRTLEKAQHLARHFGVEASSLAKLHGNFDVVINATSASLFHTVPDVDDTIFAPQVLAYDLAYAKTATPFLRQAQSKGAANCADGLGMLVFQAQKSYQIWRNFQPDGAVVLQKLRHKLDEGSR